MIKRSVILRSAFFIVNTDILIVGQGIAGTLLSYELMRAGCSVGMIDDRQRSKASLTAAAVINPLIGKTWSVARDADRVLPYALQTYDELGSLLSIPVVTQKDLIVFPEHEQEWAVLQSQSEKGNPYLSITRSLSANAEAWSAIPGHCAKVSPVYVIDAVSLLHHWSAYCSRRNALYAEVYKPSEMVLSNQMVVYGALQAKCVVFCEGASGWQNALFPQLPFTRNRGDALLLRIPGLSRASLYQRKIRLVPFGDDLFWCGSNYNWTYADMKPDVSWSIQTEKQLRDWLQMPFEVVGHMVAERPTTAGQVPLLLQHEEHQNVFLFNGLGTRGFSAGPALAREMAEKVLRS